MFSANQGVEVKKLSQIISGGELSRLMLAIKYISAQHSNTVTLIFDEIDSGVSGEIANMMGEMMQEIGKDNQLISVTHLPQVAARGQHHFMIYKKVKDGVTSTLIKPLLANDRVEEIAKLLSGKEVTETAKKNALELLNQ
jgi:DNA repair protein RecN (Recombination protein N)